MPPGECGFRKLNRLLLAGGEKLRRETQTELETARGGLALCLPGDRPDMLRGLSLRWPTTSLLIVDEAARVRETMWATISPMLAAAPLARQALLSTPAGATGEFHRAMTSGDRDWRRITVTADQCSRIAPAFLDREQHPARRCALPAGIRLRVPRRARLGLLGRRARGDVRQGRDRCRRRRWRTSSSRIERRPVRSLSGGSSTPSAMPSARRCGCCSRATTRAGKGERFWYIDGGNGYVTVSPDGDGYWIGLNGSPMLVAWARAQLAAFSTIRRVGANSLLAEMAFLPDERRGRRASAGPGAALEPGRLAAPGPEGGAAMIFATLVLGAPNRLTAIAYADVAFRPVRSFQEPARIRYLALSARVLTEAQAFSEALARVDRLTDTSAENGGEMTRDKAAVVVDVGSAHQADRRLAELVGQLPQYRKRALTVGRVALKASIPATGTLPGVISRNALISTYNSRAVAVSTEDPDDPARTVGKFVPSFRHYAPEEGDLSRDEVMGRLSAAERLDPRRIVPENEGLLELDDNEVVAAAVMLTLVAADTYSPMDKSLGDRIRNFRLRGMAH